jgi:hypothetical protein
MISTAYGILHEFTYWRHAIFADAGLFYITLDFKVFFSIYSLRYARLMLASHSRHGVYYAPELPVQPDKGSYHL